MKKILFAVIVIVALVYLGVLKFNSNEVNVSIKKGIDKGLTYAKKGAVVITEELKKANSEVKTQQ